MNRFAVSTLAPARAALLATLAFAVAPGCSSPSKADDHWNIDSVGPRVVYAFTGYEADDWKNYREFAWSKKANINRTIQRHLLNWNPDNPNQPIDESRWEPRPTNSILPKPHWYIHLEGVALGAVVYAAGGAFFPIPADSIFGTFEKGGGDEFFEGIERTLTPGKKLTASYAEMPENSEARPRYSIVAPN